MEKLGRQSTLLLCESEVHAMANSGGGESEASDRIDGGHSPRGELAIARSQQSPPYTRSISPRIPACLSYLEPSPKTLDRPVVSASSIRRQSRGTACCSPAVRCLSDVLRSCESISDWQPYNLPSYRCSKSFLPLCYSPWCFVPALCGFGDS